MNQISVAAVLFASAALAQSTADAPVERPAVLQLSLRKAIEIALEPDGNARVQLAEEAIKQSEAQQREARAALLPNIDGYFQGENFTNNLQAFGISIPRIPLLDFTLPSVVGPLNNYDARVTGTQSLFDLSAILRYRAARVSAAAVKSDRQTTRNQTADQVGHAYLAAVRADAAVEAAEADVRLSEELVRLAENQKAAGTGTGIEVTRQQVQLANDRQHLQESRNDRDVTHLQLLRVMGIHLETPFQLTDALKFAPVAEVDAASAVATAKKQRAELIAQHQHEHAAHLNYDSAKAERLPSLTAFANYGAIGIRLSDDLPTRTYGATLRIPIYNGGLRDAQRAESASEFRAERIRTADLEQQIELEVRQAIDSLHSAAAEVEAAEDGLRLSQDELAHAERRYQSGFTNSIEVTDAQTRLVRARDNRVTALYNYNVARIDLGTATGDVSSYLP